MSVHEVSVWIIMFEFEALAVLKIKEFTIVNDCFQNKSNEKIGHYGQTLNSFCGAFFTKAIIPQFPSFISHYPSPVKIDCCYRNPLFYICIMKSLFFV